MGPLSLLATARLVLILNATLYPSTRPQATSCASVAPPPATTSAFVTRAAPSDTKADERSSLISTIFRGLGAALAAATKTTARERKTGTRIRVYLNFFISLPPTVASTRV